MTTINRPNQDALYKAVNIFRDSMRPFIIRHLRRIRGTTAEDVIRLSLPSNGVEQFERNLRSQGAQGSNLAACIDINDFPHLVEKNWRDVFGSAFYQATTVRASFRMITDGRNQMSHPGDDDLDIEYVRTNLFHVIDLLERIGESDQAVIVREIRDKLVKPPAPPAPYNPQPPILDENSKTSTHIDYVKEIRTKSHQSWSNICKAVKALQDKEHEPFGTRNVENSAKSCVRKIVRETGLAVEELEALLDYHGFCQSR